MEFINITEDNFYLIEPLLRAYKYSDFRRYRQISKKELYEYIRLIFLQLANSRESRVVCLLERGKSLGVISVSFLNWDSQRFGMRLARIDYIISEGAYDMSLFLKEKLLRKSFEICKTIKVTHLSCRVDIEDISCAHVLQTHGFKIMDTIITVTYNKIKTTLPNVRSIYGVRAVKDKDIRKLMEIAQFSFKKHRFHLDPDFDNNKADKLYSEWIRNSYKMKDKIFVAIDKHDNPAGFLTYKLNLNLKEAAGLKVMGQGLMAVSAEAKGALISLMKATFSEVDKIYDYVEYDTQLNNYEVLKVCNFFNLNLVRAKYTFHKSLKP